MPLLLMLSIRKNCESFTDIGGFSFNYHKHINTGEGEY